MRIGNCSICLLISIHTPHIGSDIVRHMIYAYLTNFNPRSTHRERRCLPLHHSHCPLISIHAPRRGSDYRYGYQGDSQYDFNPRSPHGERHGFVHFCSCSISISIHAPRMGSDVIRTRQARRKAIFQSTLPAWGATWISLHRSPASFNFNPRSPHGERQARF